jgi:hypothetical protein
MKKSKRSKKSKKKIKINDYELVWIAEKMYETWWINYVIQAQQQGYIKLLVGNY